MCEVNAETHSGQGLKEGKTQKPSDDASTSILTSEDNPSHRNCPTRTIKGIVSCADDVKNVLAFIGLLEWKVSENDSEQNADWKNPEKSENVLAQSWRFVAELIHDEAETHSNEPRAETRVSWIVKQTIVFELSLSLSEKDQTTYINKIKRLKNLQRSNEHWKFIDQWNHKDVNLTQQNDEWEDSEKLPSPSPSWINEKRR